MKINTRLAFTISSISVINILILTALMHLKFHMTNMNLVKDSIAVATFSFVKSIKDSIEMGIPLESISSIQETIKSIEKNNKIIQDIQVFSIDNNSMIDQFVNKKNRISEVKKKELMKIVNSSKSQTWRYDDKNGLSFVGNTVRDNVGNDRAVVIVTYNRQFILDEEAGEIRNLYKRMIFAAILCLIFSFIIGFHYINPAEKLISNVDVVIKNILHGKESNLEDVSDAKLKISLGAMVSTVNELNRDFDILENKIQGDGK